jgi:hypothetical protein
VVVRLIWGFPVLFPEGGDGAAVVGDACALGQGGCRWLKEKGEKARGEKTAKLAEEILVISLEEWCLGATKLPWQRDLKLILGGKIGSDPSTYDTISSIHKCIVLHGSD